LNEKVGDPNVACVKGFLPPCCPNVDSPLTGTALAFGGH